MKEEILNKLIKTQKASSKLAILPTEKVDNILRQIADEIGNQEDYLLSENQKDLDKMDKANPKYDRLKLTKERLNDIANSIREIADDASPIGETLEQKTLENDLELKKIRVPIGVVGIIFEARPNVFFDCFALCFKAKNACVLKGSRDAETSNIAIYKLIQEVLCNNDIDKNIVYHIPPASHDAVGPMFKAHGLIDILIPRGSQGLIDFVRENSEIPTIETGAGIVHTYIDESADIKKAAEIVDNAKTQRPSVCNALDCLIVHRDKLAKLPKITTELANKNVEIFADEKSFEILKDTYPSELLKKTDEKSFGTEFLSLKMSIKTVGNLDEAIEHISKYSSKHSESIISEDKNSIEKFLLSIDAAAVYSNASTRFTDGGVFGLGAEIGISTQKLHARGPMGIREITSYKWVILGNGQIRP